MTLVAVAPLASFAGGRAAGLLLTARGGRFTTWRRPIPLAGGRLSLACLLALVIGASALAATGRAGAVEAPDAAAAGAAPVAQLLDAREVIVPIPGAERLRIDNPLGSVTVRAWDRREALHVVAEKRAGSEEALARLRVHYTAWANGEITVDARVELAGRERALPLSASRVDLTIEVPPELQVEAKTFAGDLSASGLRAGARLETTGGRIGVSDVRGRLVTRQLRGGQRVAFVDGDIDLDGVEGHMQLEQLAGARVEARIVDGDIRAEDLRSEVVRLSATTGAVILLGVLRPRAHYDLRSYEGDVRLAVSGAPSGFELRARSPQPVMSAFPLQVLWRQGDRVRAMVAPASLGGRGLGDVDRAKGRGAGAGAGAGERDRAAALNDGERGPPGARSPEGATAALATAADGRNRPAGPRPLVELSSTLGRVVVEAVVATAPRDPALPGGL